MARGFGNKNIKLEGFKELEAKLEKLSKSSRNSILRKGVTKGIAVVRKALRTNIKEVFGTQGGRAVVSKVMNKHGSIWGRAYISDKKYDKPIKINGKVKPFSTLVNIHEYGWGNRPAKRFFKRASLVAGRKGLNVLKRDAQAHFDKLDKGGKLKWLP